MGVHILSGCGHTCCNVDEVLPDLSCLMQVETGRLDDMSGYMDESAVTDNGSSKVRKDTVITFNYIRN